MTQGSPIQFKNLRDGDEVGSDRDIEVSVGGSKAWTRTRLELFRDCDPGSCDPVATADNQAVQWKLAAGPLSQGDHRLIARLTASDGQHEFSDSTSVNFVRSGTTFNLGFVFLIGGIASAAIGATTIAAYRRPSARR